MDVQCLRVITLEPRSGLTKLGETKFGEIHFYYYNQIILNEERAKNSEPIAMMWRDIGFYYLGEQEY